MSYRNYWNLAIEDNALPYRAFSVVDVSSFQRRLTADTWRDNAEHLKRFAYGKYIINYLEKLA